MSLCAAMLATNGESCNSKSTAACFPFCGRHALWDSRHPGLILPSRYPKYKANLPKDPADPLTLTRSLTIYNLDDLDSKNSNLDCKQATISEQSIFDFKSASEAFVKRLDQLEGKIDTVMTAGNSIVNMLSNLALAGRPAKESRVSIRSLDGFGDPNVMKERRITKYMQSVRQRRNDYIDLYRGRIGIAD
jgi:hypothetical protein